MRAKRSTTLKNNLGYPIYLTFTLAQFKQVYGGRQCCDRKQLGYQQSLKQWKRLEGKTDATERLRGNILRLRKEVAEKQDAILCLEKYLEIRCTHPKIFHQGFAAVSCKGGDRTVESPFRCLACGQFLGEPVPACLCD